MVIYDIFGSWGFLMEKRQFKNLESNLFEKKMDFYLLKSTFSSISFENARVSMHMPNGSKRRNNVSKRYLSEFVGTLTLSN